jgi:8-oxo-dGTP diphosphatase
MPPLIKVVAAIIFNSENKFLMARKKEGKPLAGFWEFPGGKVEDGEDDLSALKREIKEELNVDLNAIQFGFEYRYQYPELTIDFVFFKAQIGQGEIKLVDHDAVIWMDVKETDQYLISPIDMDALKKFRNAGIDGIITKA